VNYLTESQTIGAAFGLAVGIQKIMSKNDSDLQLVRLAVGKQAIPSH